RSRSPRTRSAARWSAAAEAPALRRPSSRSRPPCRAPGRPKPASQALDLARRLVDRIGDGEQKRLVGIARKALNERRLEVRHGAADGGGVEGLVLAAQGVE